MGFAYSFTHGNSFSLTGVRVGNGLNQLVHFYSCKWGVHCRWLFSAGWQGGSGEGEQPQQRKINGLAGAKVFGNSRKGVLLLK